MTNNEQNFRKFAEWVADEVFNELWEINYDSFAEIACRKLAKLGIVKATKNKWILVKLPEWKQVQEHCDDAISRQDAIDAMAKWDWQELYLPIHFKQLLEELPSVSTEKTGQWISWYEVIESSDGKSEDHIPHCKCSECNCEYDTYSAHFIKYCPNCGAKMEVEE